MYDLIYSNLPFPFLTNLDANMGRIHLYCNIKSVCEAVKVRFSFTGCQHAAVIELRIDDDQNGILVGASV